MSAPGSFEVSAVLVDGEPRVAVQLFGADGEPLAHVITDDHGAAALARDLDEAARVVREHKGG